MQVDSLFYEKLSFNIHPCIEEELYDGWLLRFADGYTKRANSVNVIEDSTIATEDKIRYCEEKYKARHLPAGLKLHRWPWNWTGCWKNAGIPKSIRLML